ncbi:carboxylesterase [Sphingomonas sp. Leaf357]|nr:carboxylesterase [Sphingomonas sp. Leaf357]
MINDERVVLTAGTIVGTRDGGVRSFFAIPYAAPPVGERRFAPPAPVDPWSGERDATMRGASAPQRIKDFPGLDIIPLVGDGQARGDDYLTLNVVAPVDAAGRPVMVFIHGGGFVVGSKDASVQDGTTFARDGIVYVAINYRLGIDGFLPIPGVPTNLGLRDMIAALTWVRDNIAAFGGDPTNVTVFGESAGAMAIADLIASPLAQGLFGRAIVQSGHGAMVRDISVAQRLVKKVAGLLNVSPDAAGFRAVGPDAGLDAVEAVSKPTARIDLRDAQGREPVFGISRFVPVFGDDVLPDKPVAALEKGVGADIQVLIGSNAEEMNLYFVPTGVKAKIGRLLAWFVLRKSMPRAWSVLKAYGAGKRPIGDVFVDATTDLVFRWPARMFAAAHRGTTHMYEFEWQSPAGGGLGAAHGMELPFVFDCLSVTTGPEGLTGTAPPQELASRIHALWVRFATDGYLPWPAFEADTRQVYQLARGETVTEPPMPAAPYLS